MWKGKIAGHPIHLMLVHFPIALFSMNLACSILGFYYKDQSFIKAAYYALFGGVVFAWLAGIFGVLDLSRIKKEKALQIAFWHGGLALVYLIFYTVILVQKSKVYPNLIPDTSLILGMKSVMVLLLFISAFLGGELVIKYKLN